jgi:hypothetical protein
MAPIAMALVLAYFYQKPCLLTEYSVRQLRARLCETWQMADP